MLKFTKIALLLWLSLFLTACASNAPQVVTPEGMPDIGVPVDQYNKEIGITVIRGLTTLKTKDPINLAVNAISQQMISFNHADTRTFLYDSGKWIELKNTTVFVPVDYIYILDPAQKDDMTHSGFPIVAVNLPDPNKPALLRIFVIGYVYENGVKTDKKVASYIDVNLKP